jgi:hypothetical protein
MNGKPGTSSQSLEDTTHQAAHGQAAAGNCSEPEVQSFSGHQEAELVFATNHTLGINYTKWHNAGSKPRRFSVRTS